MREAQQLSERTRQAIQDHTAMATIVAAFESVRADNARNAPADERDEFAAAILAALTDNLHELKGTTIRVDLTSSLGRRAHRLGLLVRRTKPPRD